MKKALILLMVFSVPALLFVQIWQVYSFQQLEKEVSMLEGEQKGWFEENKRKVIGIEYLSSPGRIEQLAVEELELEKIDPDKIIRIVIPENRSRVDG
ncbi:MAG: cell division protein FtsL [Spirochaetales bacterium]|nr:cell division protein FtsL [Spirochaetales bacterium]